MGEDLDAALENARQGLARVTKIGGILIKLKADKLELAEEIEELSAAYDKEHDDVEKLESNSFNRAFHSIIGGLEARLLEERSEAKCAKLRYEAALKELSSVKEQIQKLTAERDGLGGCQAEYERLYILKREALLQQNGESGPEILKLGEKIARLKSRIKETDEALDAGNQVLLRISRAMSMLNKTYWGAGIAAYAVADHVNTALVMSTSGSLMTLMREFDNQLADVKKIADIRRDSENFSKFSYIFYESLFNDSMTESALTRSHDRLSEMKTKVGSVLQKLRLMKLSDGNDIKKAEEELRAIVETQKSNDHLAVPEKPQRDEIADIPAESETAAQINALKTRINDAEEAINTGCDLLFSLERVLDRMGTAEKLGMADMIDRSAVISVVKRSYFETARAEADITYRFLTKFRNTLTRLNLGTNLKIQIGGYSEFADLYLEGSGYDFYAQAKIMESQSKLETLKGQVESIIKNLNDMKSHNCDELLRMENFNPDE